MTEDRRTTRHFAWLALVASGVLLQACTPPVPAEPGARVYAADLSGGAKSCQVAKLSPVGGQTAETTIKLGNDGGWCGLPVQQPGAKPFAAGLLVKRPAHGGVLIHEVGSVTRIDYTPDRGFTGTDSFVVNLVPGGALVRVAVTVTPPVPAAKG